MLSLKKIAFIPLFLLFESAIATHAMTPASFNHPYIGISIGGSTMLAQSAHGTLATLVPGDSPFYSNLYGHIQQENALGPVANLEAGFYLNNVFRAALALSYFQADMMARAMATGVDDLAGNGTTTSYFSAKTWLFMANFYANIGCLFPLISPHIQPYLGLGLGVANNKLGNQTTYYDGIGISGVSYSNSTKHFAYKLMAGISYDLTQNLLFNLQYAFLYAGNYESGRTGSATDVTFVSNRTLKFPIYENQLSVGFIYKV